MVRLARPLVARAVIDDSRGVADATIISLPQEAEVASIWGVRHVAMEAIDQIFVTLKHGIVAQFPEQIRWLVSVLCSIVPITIVFPLLFAITTWVERKGL